MGLSSHDKPIVKIPNEPSLSSVEKLLKASKELEISTTKKELWAPVTEDVVRKDAWRSIHEQFAFLPGKLRGTDMWTWYGKSDLHIFGYTSFGTLTQENYLNTEKEFIEAMFLLSSLLQKMEDSKIL